MGALQGLGAAKRRAIRLAIIALLCAPVAANAQGFGMPGQGDGNPLLGAWSTQQPGQGGAIFSTTLYNPDGTFVSTSHFPNDTLTRIWGQYRVQQVGPNQWRLDVQPAGFLPRQICTQIMGGPARCDQVNPPMGPQSVMASFNGPNALMNNAGEIWQRDPRPALLQAQVPEVAVQMAQAPQQFVPNPGIAPPLPSGGARYNSQPAQDFIHQRLRGCSPDPGTQHSYTICDQ